MLRVFIVLLALCFFTVQNAYAEKLSFKAMETKVCDSSKQACKNFKKLYNKAKGSKVGGRIDASTDEWELKAYTNKGSLTANIHLMAYHKERKVKYEAMMTYKRKNKFSSWELVKE